jgi:hypothetical protein
MNLSKLNPNYRFIIAVSTAIGVSQVLQRAFTTNFGPSFGLLATVVVTAALAGGISWALEKAARKQQATEAAGG